MNVRRAVTAGVCSSVLFVGALASSAQAQEQDGLVNVVVGDVTILEDVAVGIAAAVAANICGVKVGPVAILATQVDQTGNERVVCEATATRPEVTITN
jgi:hypothetical protein